MRFPIKHRWSAIILFECELSAEISQMNYGMQLGFAVREALKLGADLSEADLSEADLRAANLRAANLGAANLRAANLRAANLRAANLRAADLSAADLSPVRDDFFAVLSLAPREVEGLRQALINGRVNGTTYSGECACLVGTIANIRGCAYSELGPLRPNLSRPIERFFLSIKQGDTPETNQFSRCALEWATEWQNNMRAAFGTIAS